MNVLTIDLDYMSTNYAKLVDTIYSNAVSYTHLTLPTTLTV